ncbi:hypothetical protein [Mesorhizobium sp. M1088]|uniref:hypothetical protein n=1 Tax=unclassified Mesorhizobium TaxID=325217 RepID=UPI00333A4A62
MDLFKRIEGLIFAVLMLLLTLAVGGAVMALIGAVFGLSSTKTIGGSIAGLSAAGFFSWMLVTSKFVRAFRAFRKVPSQAGHREQESGK